ncbi:MAG: molybdopterin-dependent oxidoreductase [Nitrososphaerota archaeon]|nr:molybdopterin-dependent oxidoreductase [Nitrososphaerota archaeon]
MTLAQEHEAVRIVGASLQKVDTLEKITSGGRYVINYETPGMLHGKVLRSNRAHARITRIDTSKAESMPGVVAVITYRDCPQTRYSPMFALESHSDRLIRDKLILENYVRYVGDEVAAVAATSEEIASRALDLIEVDYQEFPAVLDAEQAMKDGAPLIHETKNNIARHVTHGFGDVEKALKESDFLFEHRFRTSRVHPCPMERHVCICELDASGTLVVRSSTQGIYGVRERLAEALGLPISKVKVIKPPYIGGGFGAKLELWLEGMCALLTLKSRRAVKIELSRTEEFLANPRMPCIIDLKTGINKDGTFGARYAKVLFDTGGYAAHGAVIHRVFSGTFVSMYRCPNTLCESFVVYTNNPIGGSIRGSTSTQAIYAVEQQVDIISREMKFDPLEFRIKNAWKIGDTNPKKPSAGPIKSYAFEECVRQGAERFDWYHRNKVEGKRHRSFEKGIGVACEPIGISGTQGGDYHGLGQSMMEVCSAFVKVNEDGTVALTVATVDQGGGQNTVLSQVVAEVMCVPLANVILMDADTDAVALDGPTHASRVTFVVGNTVKSAAEDARNQLLEFASKVFVCSSKELEIRNGYVRNKTNPSQRMALGELVRNARYSDPGVVILGRSALSPRVENATPCAVQFVEVEVDTDTGEVRVLRILSVHDVGKAINPHGVEGQIHGGVRLGLGYALTEEIVTDPVTGTPLNTDLLGYKMFTSADMPKIECLLIEKPDPNGPFGAKGMGESPAMLTAPAVANAVYDAVGVRIMDLPITPEKILRALGKIA